MKNLLSFASVIMIAGAAACLAAPPKKTPPPQTGHDEVLSWANAIGAIAYGLTEDSWNMDFGLAIQLDEPNVVIDGPLEPGIWWVIAGNGPCDRMVENEVLGIGLADIDANGGISTECGSGWYACCYCDGNDCPVARCRQNGTPEVQGGCQGGGPGSTACSISRDACPE